MEESLFFPYSTTSDIKLSALVTGKGTGLEWICLGASLYVWLLDFLQERFQNTGPGDFECTFSIADSETKKGLA